MGLAHYRAVLRQQRLPMWWQSKQVTCAICLTDLSTDELWCWHEELLTLLRRRRKDFSKACPGSSSLLEVKRELTRRLYRTCCLCPWRCGVDRLEGEKGVCGLATKAHVFREGLLVSEESFVVPTHELFLTGCNMRCAFCQAWEGVVCTQWGVSLSPQGLESLVRKRQVEGARNLHFVGGEPTVNLLAVLEALQSLTIPLPLVWNTNLFVTDEAMRLLDGLVDLFLADFKFGNDGCAQRIGKVEGYVATLQRNLPWASRIASLVIRHLVMPGHLECCLEPVARWVAEHLPSVPFHLLLNYVPDWRAWDNPDLSRRLTEGEKQSAQRLVRSLGLRRVLITP